MSRNLLPNSKPLRSPQEDLALPDSVSNSAPSDREISPYGHAQRAHDIYSQSQEKEINRTALFYGTLRALTKNENDLDRIFDRLIAFDSKENRNHELAYFLASSQLQPARSSYLATHSNLDLQQKIETELITTIRSLPTENQLEVWDHYKNITRQFYEEVNRAIDQDELKAFRESINETLRFKVNRKTKSRLRRHQVLRFVNGDTLAGKNTSATLNGIQLIETGTEGILGHTDAYHAWAASMTPFDVLRGTGMHYPNNLMIISLGIELAERRSQLDEAGKIHEPLTISGYPRDEAQALAFFFGIEPEQIPGAVYLVIQHERTWIERSLFRIAECIISGEDIRPDDRSSLAIDGGMEEFLEMYSHLINALVIPSLTLPYSKKQINEAKTRILRPFIQEYLKGGTVTLTENARWIRDCEKRDKIMITLEEQLHIPVIQIFVDELTMEDQAAAVARALQLAS